MSLRRTSAKTAEDPTAEPEQAAPGVPEQQLAAEKVYAAIAGLREDARGEAGLGDAARQTRNIAVSDAAWELRTLIKDSSDNVQLAIESGAIAALVRALRQRPNSEAVQSKCTTTLGYLAVDNEHNQTRIGKEGGVEVVINALRGHPNSVSVLEHSVEALGQLVAHDHHENQHIARLAGGIEAVAIALHQHPENEALQKNAATTLGLLVINNAENQLHCGRARGIQALVSCLKSHLKNEAILEKGAVALRHVVTSNIDNQELAREAGTIATLLAVLRRHRKCEAVQLACMRAMTEIVVDNPQNQEMAGEAGGIKAIISALNGHPASDSVQERACETLGHLVANNQVNQNLSREAGLIEAVIHTALEQHPASIPVQTKASSTLTSLVIHNADSQRLAGAAKGVEVVTAGLKRHLDCESVIEEASRALSSLVLNNRENQTTARSAGAIEAVILVLRQHPTNSVVQMRALQSLRNLVVGNHENTRVAVSAGGIDEVVTALRQPPEPVERASSRQGSRGASRPDASKKHHSYQKLAREAGVIEACVGALKQPGGCTKADKTKVMLNKINAAPIVKLLTAVWDVVAGSYESQRLAAEAGAVETVLDLIKSDPYNEVIQEHAAKALSGLIADNAANQRRAKSEMADDALTEAFAVHPENDTVLEAIGEALEALRSGEYFADRIMLTDYGQRHSCPVSIVDTAMRSVTLEQLLELQDFIQKTLRKHDLVDPPSASSSSLENGKQQGKSVTWEDLTMYQLRDHFILPLTSQHRCSFVEAVAKSKEGAAPMWMISHWWGTPFPFTVRMLQLQSRSRHLHATSSVSYWCCAFANNQHEHSELDETDVLRSPFARAMLSQSCMGTVLLCDTEVTPLLRTWCVFEAHVTQLLRCGTLQHYTDKKRYFLDILAPVVYKDPEDNEQDKVTITMLQDAIGGSWNEVTDTEGVFFPLGIAHLGVRSDVRMAETTDESDKAIILNFLTQGRASKEPPPAVHPKYDEFNDFVHSVFASAELYRVASEQPQECVEAATELIQMRADVNSFVRQGNTPLFAAAGADPLASGMKDEHMQRDLVQLLLTARADVNRANASLKTVLDCSSSLSEASKDLLLQHGAKSFVDAAPELERSANAQLVQILATGFMSEQQAFVGGDAGTKLTAAAQHSLQVAATSCLKLYHWAPARMCIQTGAKRHQAQLASDRARSIMLALESAGCKNPFEIQFGTQRVLLGLTLSIAISSKNLSALSPPSVLPDGIKIARWERHADVSMQGSEEATKLNLRNPGVELSLRPVLLTAAQEQRLPPATVKDGRMQLRRLPPVSPGIKLKDKDKDKEVSPIKLNILQDKDKEKQSEKDKNKEEYSESMTNTPTHASNAASSAKGWQGWQGGLPASTNGNSHSRGSDRGDGLLLQGTSPVDLESSMYSNGSSLCELEALQGNGPWPIASNGQVLLSPGRDTGRPGTRQDKRRPDMSGVRCEAWGSAAASYGRHGTSGVVAQQSSSGGFNSQSGPARKFHQTANSTGGFGSSSPLTGLDHTQSSLSSMPPTPSDGAAPQGTNAETHLEVLAAGDRWFQTSIRCSLSQPDLNINRSTQRKQREASNSNCPSGKVIDQFGTSVPPTASGGRPARGQVGAIETVAAEGQDGRPPTRCGRRPGRGMAAEVSSVSGGPANRDLINTKDLFAKADDFMLPRTSSLPALSAPVPRAARAFRVSDLMD